MASSYTTNNGLEKPGTGDQTDLWGLTNNENFDLIDEAMAGQVTVTLPATGTSGSPNSLPITDGASSTGRHKFITFNDGADLGGTSYVQLVPSDAEKICYLRNSLSGDRAVIVFQGSYSASRDLEIPNGKTVLVRFDGAGAGATVSEIRTTSDLGAPDSVAITGGTITGITDLEATGGLLEGVELDSTCHIVDETDNTKRVGFVVSGITTATTRSWTFPDSNGTFVGVDLAQTLTNKTLSSGVLSGTFTGDPEFSGNPVFSGGPDFSTATNLETVRSDLGLEIGVDVQAYDATLTLLGGVTPDVAKIPYFTAADAVATLDFKDEDDMASDSPTAIPSQQSVKAYVDASSAKVFLASQDASNSATLDFTEFDASLYDAYEFVISNLVPATDGVSLWIRTSTDGGSTYDSGASDYGYMGQITSIAGPDRYGTTGAQIVANSGLIGSAASEDGWSGTVTLPGPHLAKRTMIHVRGAYWDTSTAIWLLDLAGFRLAAADVDAIRFMFSSGDIESGSITMYGLRNA